MLLSLPAFNLSALSFREQCNLSSVYFLHFFSTSLPFTFSVLFFTLLDRNREIGRGDHFASIFRSSRALLVKSAVRRPSTPDTLMVSKGDRCYVDIVRCSKKKEIRTVHRESRKLRPRCQLSQSENVLQKFKFRKPISYVSSVVNLKRS